MAEEKQVTEQAKEELVDKEVIDPIEANFGDKAKAKKIIKVKKEAEVKADAPVVQEKPTITQEVKPKEEPAPEQKPKEKEKAPEAKKIEIKDDDYFDPLSQIKKPEAKQSEKKLKEESSVTKTPEQLKDEVELPEIKKAAQAYQKLTSTPQGKFLVKLASEGEDIWGAIQTLQPRDYANMDEDSLAREYFSKIEGLSGEALQAAVDEHFELPEMSNARRREVREFRATLSYDQQQRFSKYEQDLTTSKTKGQEIIPKFHSEVESEIEQSYVSKPAYGIKLTPDQASELQEQAKSIFSRLIDPNTGEVNAKLVAFYAFAEKHFPTIRKNDYMKGLTEGQEKILEAVTQPDRMPASLQAPSRVDKEDDIARINRQYGGQPAKP